MSTLPNRVMRIQREKGKVEKSFGLRQRHCYIRQSNDVYRQRLVFIWHITLYLNLEGYSGFDHMLSETLSKDISDFIYYVNQVSEDISLITQNYIYRLGEMDMIGCLN